MPSTPSRPEPRAKATTQPALWRRVLCFPPIRLLLLSGVLILTMAASKATLSAQLEGWPLADLRWVAEAGLCLAVYAGLVRFVEGRRVSELALPGLGREFGIGLLVGAGLYTGCVLILMLTGLYRVEGLNPLANLQPALVMTLSLVVFDELLLRGVLFRIIEESLGSWIALAVTSFVGGLSRLHPDEWLTSALFGTIHLGVVPVAAFMLTRRLWMSMGLNMAWMNTLLGIFSGNVSDSESGSGLVRASIDGPAWLTGGSVGLHVSLVAFVLWTATGVALLVMAARRGNVVRPFWQRRG